jgi:hypothetical protein
MSRETPQALGARSEPFDTRHQDELDMLICRLANVERAYEELLGRVRRYEQERRDIRARLGRILGQLAHPRATPAAVQPTVRESRGR